MFKGNSFILIFTVLVLLIIILVSITPLLIKTLLALVSIALLVPIFRKIMMANRGRKIKAAFYTSLAFTIIYFLFTEKNFTWDILPFLLILLFFSILGNFLYGLPASIIAELVSKKLSNYRFWVSGFIHIGFGLATYLIEPGFFLPAVICSVLFFAFDEMI
jgi:hypothetical protein